MSEKTDGNAAPEVSIKILTPVRESEKSDACSVITPAISVTTLGRILRCWNAPKAEWEKSDLTFVFFAENDS